MLSPAHSIMANMTQSCSDSRGILRPAKRPKYAELGQVMVTALKVESGQKISGRGRIAVLTNSVHDMNDMKLHDQNMLSELKSDQPI